MHAMTGVSTSPKLHGRGASKYTDLQLTQAALYPSSSPKSASPVTVLENDVWVGDGAVIVPGVRIGTGAVIGANAVVTRNVDPYTVVGGIPARPLKVRFSSQIVDALLSTEYWEYPTEYLQSLPCANVFEFIETFEVVGVPREGFSTFGLMDGAGI